MLKITEHCSKNSVTYKQRFKRMLNLSIVLFICIVSIYLPAYSHRFEITPIVFDLKGVEAKNDTIIAYGEYGCILMSYNNGKDCRQVRVFDGGTIVGFFWDDLKMIAFNNIGDVSESYDKGRSWVYRTNIGDSIRAIIKIPTGYLIRAGIRIRTLKFDLSNDKEYPLISEELYITGSKKLFTNSIAYFKDKFIISTIDTCNMIVLDSGLNLLDTLNPAKLGILDKSYNFSWLKASSNFLYFKNSTNTGFKLFKTFDLITAVADTTHRNPIYTVKNDSLYFFERDYKKEYFIDTTKLSNSQGIFAGINDFTVSNNKKIIVGDRKIFEIMDMSDSTLRVISDFSGFGLLNSPPVKIGDSSYLFYSGGTIGLRPYFYRTDDNGATVYPTVNTMDPKYEKNFSKYEIKFKHYNEIDHKFYFGAALVDDMNGYVFSSDDTCKSFSKIKSDFRSMDFNTILNSLLLIEPMMQKDGNEWVLSAGGNLSHWTGSIVSLIYRLDKDYKVINMYRDTTQLIDCAYSKDTNSYLIRCVNPKDSISEIKYTSNRGKSWDLIFRYNNKLEILRNYQQIKYKNEDYWLLMHQNYTDSIIYLDAVNLEDRKLIRLAGWQANKTVSDYCFYGLGLYSDSDQVYISIQDTLFCTNDLFNKKNWDYYIIPKNGRIARPLKKFGDKFYGMFKDDDTPWTNNTFWIKPLDPITVSVKETTESENYLYTFPAYPTPSRTQVRSLIYWDLSIDIDNDEIGVYDIYGIKVAGREDIIIDKQTTYNGTLIWDCTAVPSGIYLIKINHGTKSMTIKAMVEK